MSEKKEEAGEVGNSKENNEGSDDDKEEDDKDKNSDSFKIAAQSDPWFQR